MLRRVRVVDPGDTKFLVDETPTLAQVTLVNKLISGESDWTVAPSHEELDWAGHMILAKGAIKSICLKLI
jgi:hypothetical protein